MSQIVKLGGGQIPPGQVGIVFIQGTAGDPANADPGTFTVTFTASGGDFTITSDSATHTVDFKLAQQVTGTDTTIGAVLGTTITFPLGATPSTYQFVVDTVGFDPLDALGESVHEIVTVRTDGATATIIDVPDYFSNIESGLTPSLFFTTVSGNNVVVKPVGSPLKTINWFSKLAYIKVS